jgi:hypothetical protein
MNKSKWSEYYLQILDAKEFPFTLKHATKGNELSAQINHWIRKHKLPFQCVRTISKITIYKEE